MADQTKVNFLDKAKRSLSSFCECAWKIGKEDPRRTIHAIKVGVALTLVSLLYLLEPLFQGMGQNVMWAVMTVVVVFEFTAGATVCKGLNRGFGTIVAVALTFLIDLVAKKSCKVLGITIIAMSVFIIGFMATYLRFIPYIKKSYDYGVVIFLLTFNLIAISSFRVESIQLLARERLYMIAIGCGICLLMSFTIFPCWSGEDLQKSTVDKLKSLAKAIEDCVNEYFKDEEKYEDISTEGLTTDNIYDGYRVVLDSKASDDSLALFASWEPKHSWVCYKHPWRQYVKLGVVLRHFGYTAVALNGCLKSEIQTPQSIRALFRRPCIQLAEQVCRVVNELASSISNRRHCDPSSLSNALREALQDLNSAINNQPNLLLDLTSSTRVYSNISLDSKLDKRISTTVSNSSFKSDDDASSMNVTESRAPSERRMLRPTLSKVAMASLQFSEALPFAAFVSLLVEMVTKLELVIEEVEELGRAARFKEHKEGEIEIVTKNDEKSFESNSVSTDAVA